MSTQKKLRIGLFAFGTDGDIQPLIELASGLYKNGHSIELALICLRNRDYSYLQKDGFNVQVIPYVPASGMEEFSHKEFWHFSDSEFSRYFELQFNSVRNTIRRCANQLVKKVDILISVRLMYPVRFSAEQQGIPYICLHFAHSFIRSRHYLPFGSEDRGWAQNLAAWDAGDDYANQYLLPKYNKFRALYKLAPCTDFYADVHHSAELNLVAFSQYLLPADLDWDKHFHLCGYFKRDVQKRTTAVDRAINEFIDKGNAVIGVTFGSLLEYESEPEIFLQKIANTIRALGQRAVILVNQDYGLTSDDRIFYATGYVDHEALFSRCRLVVHHGGAGTTHVVSACGAPSLLVAYGFDQFSIGALLIKQGICLGMIARKDFSTERFTHLLTASLADSELIARAHQIGRAMSSERGVEQAVHFIEKKYA